VLKLSRWLSDVDPASVLLCQKINLANATANLEADFQVDISKFNYLYTCNSGGSGLGAGDKEDLSRPLFATTARLCQSQ